MRRRWNAHRKTLRNGTHHTRPLQNAWNKYGETAFTFTPLLICASGNLTLYEQRAMDALCPEYNVRRDARSNLGIKVSAEGRARMSAAQKGNKGPLGWIRTPEHCARIAAAKRGKPRPDMRKPRSPETIAKLSKPRNWTKEGLARIAAATSYKRSPEVRQRMSEAHRGQRGLVGFKHSAEARANMSRARMGTKQSPETIAKRKATIAARRSGLS